MLARFKDPKFIAMLLAPVLAALTLFINGQVDLKGAISSAVAGVVAGILGIVQPQSTKAVSDGSEAS